LKSNRRGFTMIEFIVYMGGLGLVSLLVSTVIMATQNILMETRRSLNVEELHAQILLSLTNPISCYNTFDGLMRVAGPTTIPNIINSTGTILYSSGGGPYMQNVSIVSIQSNNYIGNPAAAAPAPYTGTFDLTIVYQVPVDGGGFQNRTRVITVRTELGAVGTRLVASTATSTNRCTSGTATGFGYDPNRYVQRDRMDNVAKQGDLTIQGQLNVLAWVGNPPGVPTQSGSIRAYGGLYTISDRRFKKDIEPLNPPFNDSFNLIQGKEFVWKKNGNKDYGFIAQDVEKVFPDLVTQRKDDSLKTVNYLAFIPLMHESYKRMDVEYEQLEKRLRVLERNHRKNIK
jgi:hypothetical protein